MSWDEGEYFATSFQIHKWRRYHQKRHDYYRRLHIWGVSFNIFCGSAAFILIQASAPNFAAVLSAGCALSALIDLVIKSERAAQSHHFANRALTELAAKLESWAPTEKNLRRAKAERLKITTDPPQVTRLLVELLAHNEEARARGVPEAELVPLSTIQRFLGPFCTFGIDRVTRWKAEREIGGKSSDDNIQGWITSTGAEAGVYVLAGAKHRPA